MIHTEIVLEGDGGKGAVLSCDGNALFRLNGLVQTVVIAAPKHKAAGKFVDYYDLAVFYNVVNIPFHNAVGFYRLVYVVEQSHIVRVVDIFNVKVFFCLFRAPWGKGGGVCLFVDDVICVDVVGFFLVVVLLHLNCGKGADESVRLLVKVGGFVAAP